MALHPPKVETFDVAAGTNTDPKGFVRAVDLYREEPFGLYLSRPMPDHPTLTGMRSWLLPDLGVRVTDFDVRPGHAPQQDLYLDVADVTRHGDAWTTVDHYLDIAVWTHHSTRVLDVDEYVAAVAAGVLATDAAERAFTTTTVAHAGIVACGHDVEAWLATRGIALDWPRGRTP